MSPVREHSKTCGCKWKLYKQLFVSVVLLVSVDIAFVRGREVLFLRGSWIYLEQQLQGMSEIHIFVFLHLVPYSIRELSQVWLIRHPGLKAQVYVVGYKTKLVGFLLEKEPSVPLLVVLAEKLWPLMML